MPTCSPDPLDRVRGLLTEAGADNTTPHDALALTASATSLLAQFGLDRAHMAAVDPEADAPTDLAIDLDNPWANVQAYLLAHLAQALRCEAIEIARPGHGARLHVFGYACDIERTEILYT